MGQTSVLELWLLDWIYSPSESIHLAQAETESKNNPINNSIIKTHIYKTTVVHVHVFIFSLKRFKLLKILMIYLIKLKFNRKYTNIQLKHIFTYIDDLCTSSSRSYLLLWKQLWSQLQCIQGGSDSLEWAGKTKRNTLSKLSILFQVGMSLIK